MIVMTTTDISRVLTMWRTRNAEQSSYSYISAASSVRIMSAIGRIFMQFSRETTHGHSRQYQRVLLLPSPQIHVFLLHIEFDQNGSRLFGSICGSSSDD